MIFKFLRGNDFKSQNHVIEKLNTSGLSPFRLAYDLVRCVFLICRDVAIARSIYVSVCVFYGNNILVRIKKDT